MWALGALSFALTLVAMVVLNCVHPPAGALALLPSLDDRIRDMGWWYLTVQIVFDCVCGVEHEKRYATLSSILVAARGHG